MLTDMNKYNTKLFLLVKVGWEAFLLHIQVPGSNLSLETGLPD
jgi:hypothetical protein